jgi:broad specificity phosphatase PhoE
MTTVHLVRHAQAAKIQGDPGLTATGREQAQRVAALLRLRPIVALYASPLRRAVETAATLSEALALPVALDARLRERANWGDDPAQSWPEFLAMWTHSDRERDWLPPVGDSPAAAARRMAAFLKMTMELHGGQEIVAVTHGGILGDWLTEQFPDDYLAALDVRWLAERSAWFANGSVTTVAEADGEWQVLALAGERHLE